MTTSDLIALLQKNEKGFNGIPRELSFVVNGIFIAEPDVVFNSCGSGICGEELTLEIKNGTTYGNDGETNFGKIKNMSIEEMTEFLHNSVFSIPNGSLRICEAVCDGFCRAQYKPECVKKIKQWLESEVVVNDTTRSN